MSSPSPIQANVNARGTAWKSFHMLNIFIIIALSFAWATQPVATSKAAAASRAPESDGRAGAVPKTGSWFGSTTGMGNDDEDVGRKTELDEHQDFIGRKLATVRVYKSWDVEFPDDFDYWLKDQGQIPVVSWSSWKEDRVSYVRWAAVASGKHDAVIDARAEDIKAYGSPIYLAFQHEPEPKKDRPIPGTPADFIAAWQHIHDRFETDGVTNVKWIMILLNSSYNLGLADDYYPGNDYVDVLGADGYNWFGCANHPGAPWETFTDLFEGFYSYGQAKGKDMFITEYGTGEDRLNPLAKALFFTEASTVMKTWPRMKALMYFDHNEDPDCVFWVGSSDLSATAFRTLGADEYFNPPPPLVWILKGPPPLSRSPNATFMWVANESPMQFSCSLDGSRAKSCVSGVTYTNVEDGEHVLSVTGMDRSGARGSATYEWKVQT